MNILDSISPLAQDIDRAMVDLPDEDIAQAATDTGLVGECARAELAARYPYLVLHGAGSESGDHHGDARAKGHGHGFDSVESAASFIAEKLEAAGEEPDEDRIAADMGANDPRPGYEQVRYSIVMRARDVKAPLTCEWYGDGMKLDEIADRIHSHLERIEADTALNAHPTVPGQTRLADAQAYATRSSVRVTYRSFQGESSITKQQAEAYLDALDEGYLGKHHEHHLDAWRNSRR